MKKNISVLLIFLCFIYLQPYNINQVYSKSIEKKVSTVNGLIKLKDLDTSFSIDLRYATKNNFTGRVLYPKAITIININTAKKLIKANNYLKKYGYHIKIYDAYRPYDVQKLMWKLCSKKEYLSNPKNGSNHNRGAAVDITMVDKNDKEVLMPSSFDEFSERAHIDYTKTSKEAIANRELLAKAMIKSGFKRIRTEWWHFDDLQCKLYPIQNISFDKI